MAGAIPITSNIGAVQTTNEWGKIIANYLKPDGFFYIAEMHPFSMVFDDESKDIKI